jgi:hypothetical protein
MAARLQQQQQRTTETADRSVNNTAAQLARWSIVRSDSTYDDHRAKRDVCACHLNDICTTDTAAAYQVVA